MLLILSILVLSMYVTSCMLVFCRKISAASGKDVQYVVKYYYYLYVLHRWFTKLAMYAFLKGQSGNAI